MFNAFERAVAFRYLRARKGERFVSFIAIFSLIGIALGVATLIVVMSVMNGFRQELLGRVLRLNPHVLVLPANGRQLPDYQAMTQRLRALPEVVQVAPVIEGQVLLTTESGGASGALARGISAEDLRARRGIGGAIRRGVIENFQGEDAIILGLRLAYRLRVGLGDRVTLVLPRPRGADLTTAPQMRAYRVVALFETGLPEYDNGQVFLPLAAAQRYFGLPDAVNRLEVFVRDPANVSEASDAIRQALEGMPVKLRDWQDSNSALFSAMVVERNVMFLILTLIILVAAFNIVSSLVMLVKDKGKDIAILRTMGATRGAILRIFLLCGASVGVLGTLLGFGIGLLFCANIEGIRQLLMRLTGTKIFDPGVYFLTRIPAVVDPGEVAQVLAMGLGLSLVATLYPSWRAARLDPVEALRNE
jgi:lipoprotein-releasing system permease protein